ncbi:MAG TPA: cation:proton antiporter [Polyangia bacterium]|jgi:CPA2 family monovalent cation:H+ antiporter-2
MPAAHSVDLLTDLALILCVAAVTTMLFQWLRQPVVLGYLLAGVVVGPHLPVPLFVDEQLTHNMSELGVVLLMFSLGLEFSLRKLIKVAPTAGIVAVIQCSLMIWLGYLVARLFHWTVYEALFAGAALAISSTTIIVKAFSEQKVSGRLREIVFGILIAEDLIAILLLTILTAVSSRAGLSAGALALSIGKLAGFLAVLLVGGMLIVPRLMRAVVRLRSAETTVVAAVGVSFAFALLARWQHYSVALGAFLAGALVAESGAARIIEHRIEPVRDVFAAVFFVSVGMMIDPHQVWAHLPEVLVLTGVVVIGKLIGVSVGTFLTGYGVRTSVQAGLSLGQIGEFSFIIAAVGLDLGVIGPYVYPVAVGVSALTTLLTPWLIRGSGRLAALVDARLPDTLQTYAALYGAWVNGLRATPEHRTAWARIRRLVRLLVVDIALLAAIVIASSLAHARLSAFARDVVHIDPRVARPLLVGATVVLIVPFIFGAVRMARALGVALASEALPAPPGGARDLDLAAAPRRALLVTLQIAILLVAGIPVIAVTQPFMPGFPGMAVLLAGVALLVVPLWRSATNLQGHVRAGAQVILEALAAQSGTTAPAAPPPAPAAMLPGLGNATAVPIAASSPAVGRTLKQINLRGLTGATVIAIDRDAADVIYPTGDETLHAGDALIVTGTTDAVQAAQELVAAPGAPTRAGE